VIAGGVVVDVGVLKHPVSVISGKPMAIAHKKADLFLNITGLIFD